MWKVTEHLNPVRGLVRTPQLSYVAPICRITYILSKLIDFIASLVRRGAMLHEALVREGGFASISISRGYETPQGTLS